MSAGRTTTEWDIYHYGSERHWWSAIGLHGHLRKLTTRGYLNRFKSGTYRYALTDRGREVLESTA
jgi:hypothetical protein